VFKTDYNDLQITQLVQIGGVLATQIYNAGTALFRGGEAELTILPYPGWQLNATLGLRQSGIQEIPVWSPPNQIDVHSIAHVGDTATTHDLRQRGNIHSPRWRLGN